MRGLTVMLVLMCAAFLLGMAVIGPSLAAPVVMAHATPGPAPLHPVLVTINP